MEDILFKEVIEEIGKDVKVIRGEASKKIYTIFQVLFPFRFSAIDWEKIDKKVEVDTIEEVITAVNMLVPNANMETIALWDDADTFPCKAKLTKFLWEINTITILGSRTWIFCPISRYAIEYYNIGGITIGVAPDLNTKLEVAYKNFLQTKIKKEEFPLEYRNIITDIISVGEHIAVLAVRILAHEEIDNADQLVIQKEYLTKSAWRIPFANPCPLVKIPPVLDYARKMEELKSLCSNVLLYREVLKL